MPENKQLLLLYASLVIQENCVLSAFGLPTYEYIHTLQTE